MSGRTYDTQFQPQWPALVAPFAPEFINSAGVSTANTARGCRVVVPRTGNLRDVTAYVGTQSGNMMFAVYDTNDASAGNRSRLWDSGSIAVSTGSAWQTVADPNLAVVAGQQLDLVLFADNSTAQFGRFTAVNAAVMQLPTSYLPATGGALPKLFWTSTLGGFSAPNTIAEASLTLSSSGFFVMGRIS